jgi:hypothetical protein
MTGPLRLIPALALAAVFATSAKADFYHLSTHGDWDVVLNADAEGKLSCAASTENLAGEVFDLTMWQDGLMQAFFIFEGDAGIHQRDIDVVITGADRWALTAVTFTEYGAVFTFPSVPQAVEFMLDVQAGTSLGIAHPNQRKTFGDFSLRGSRAAITSLFECYRRISGVAA